MSLPNTNQISLSESTAANHKQKRTTHLGWERERKHSRHPQVVIVKLLNKKGITKVATNHNKVSSSEHTVANHKDNRAQLSWERE